MQQSCSGSREVPARQASNMAESSDRNVYNRKVLLPLQGAHLSTTRRMSRAPMRPRSPLGPPAYGAQNSQSNSSFMNMYVRGQA